MATMSIQKQYWNMGRTVLVNNTDQITVSKAGAGC